MRWIAMAIALAAVTGGCAEGEDKDGATSFARPGDDDDRGGDETFGDADDDPSDATTGTMPQAGGVSDSSDPGADDPAAEGTGGDAPPPPPPPPPPGGDPPPPGAQPLPCEAFCLTLEACGLEPDVAACMASECAPLDGGGPCDQAFDAMFACVALQPDCGGVVAWFDGVPGYPCQTQEEQIEFSCA